MGAATVALLCSEARTEQPIFDEMPRWNDGWGVQVLAEYQRARHLLDGSDVFAPDTPESAYILRVEGVYTFTKAYRLTLKIPVVLDAQRTQPVGPSRQLVSQTDQGLAAPVLTMPLKSYFNLDGRSGSWTLAPQVSVRVGPQRDYTPIPQVWGAGLGVGYETETYRYHFGTSLSGWWYEPGLYNQPSLLTWGIGGGLNVQALGSSGHIKLKANATVQTDSSVIVDVGPLVYWRLSDLWHAQLLWRRDVFNSQGRVRPGDRDVFRVGLGVVF